MRSVLALLLAVTVVFVPAVQAESCFCGTESAAEASMVEASCCCADTAACRCTGCDHGDADGGDRGDALSSCVCTKTQPQANLEHSETIVLAEALPSLRFHTPEREQRVRTAPTTPEGDVGPPTYRPLLI